jgi:hypothetical protein
MIFQTWSVPIDTCLSAVLFRNAKYAGLVHRKDAQS